MRTFFNNAGLIDYMSPQLYTSGSEGSNDFTANGVGWAEYKAFSGKLIPSIVTGNYYGNAQSTFKNYGVTTAGYVQWSQTVTGGSSSGPVSKKTVPTTRCGSSWAAASSSCGKKCTTNADCPGSACFADLATNGCPASAVAGSSSTYDGSSSSSAALEPAAIGIIVAGCLIGIVMIVIVTVVMLKVTKRVESV